MTREITVEVFRNLDLAIENPEIVGIMGESGSGKSTLLNLVGLLDSPTSGRISFAGEEYLSIKDKASFRSRNIGFIFQNHLLLDDFTALENVMIPYLIRNPHFSKAREEALFWLKEVGLEHRAEHKPGEMSGGENQRAAIARALINNPSMILADEPTGNLDFANQEKINELFIDISNRYKKIVLVATHNESFAAKCHSLYRFKTGQLERVR